MRKPKATADTSNSLPPPGEVANLYLSGKRTEARELCEQILRANPDQPEALNFLSMMLYREGREKEAVASLQRSIELAPDYFSAHANLGNMMIGLDRHEEAAIHLDRALQLSPGAPGPTAARATMLRLQNKPAEAEALLRPALGRSPDDLSLLLSLANALAAQGKVREALNKFRQIATQTEPGSAAWRMVAESLARLGYPEDALEMCQEQLKRTPDDPHLNHLIAALGAAPVPDRASDEYVRSIFDGFANTFEGKLGKLRYCAPELVQASCEKFLTSADASLRVLDAGCGTGLLAPLIKPWCQELIGVDLSAGMLTAAAKRKLYDELHEAELTVHLESRPDAYDLIVCADTLCYFGSLEKVFEAAYGALRCDGWLIFTVEHGESQAEPIKLHPHGRYSHQRDYVAQALETVGFDKVYVATHPLRTESGKPVSGLVISVQKPLAHQGP